MQDLEPESFGSHPQAWSGVQRIFPAPQNVSPDAKQKRHVVYEQLGLNTGGPPKETFPTNICPENKVTLQSFLASQRYTESFIGTKGKLGFSTF